MPRSDPPYTCDQCGQPILEDEQGCMIEPVYASAFDDERRTGRHWRCHRPIEEVFGDLRKSLRKIEEKLGVVKERMRR